MQKHDSARPDTSSGDATTSAPAKRRFPLKIVIALVVLVGIIILFRTLPVAQWFEQFQAYIRGVGPIGYVIYALVYAACCVLFIPASVLTLGAGAIFGLVAGTIVVVIGATLGAILSFLLARTVMRKKVEAMTEGNAKFTALDRAISKEGARIVFLIRLAPIFPFTYINYAFGLTGVRTLPFILATLVGIIPGTFAYIYIGHAAASAAAGGADRTKTIVQIAGAVVALVVTLFVARIATKAIKKAGVDEKKPSDPRSQSSSSSEDTPSSA
ncbi:MAG TPA: TVP38/TMEM64 family protein [Thermoanaerobaculia bacterium]|nr:TVP38/TMEM64 family protein [Thermoanaerobaculia bacterium]